jgi:hypothetical protein
MNQPELMSDQGQKCQSSVHQIVKKMTEEEIREKLTFLVLLSHWIVDHDVTHAAADDLLQLLHTYQPPLNNDVYNGSFKKWPMTGRTLLQVRIGIYTSPSVTI